MIDRFVAKVGIAPDGCFIWTGARTPLGYGVFRRRGRAAKAHRVAYELLVGPIPDGLELDHLCRNTSCVNPDHLEAVTHAENVRRGISHWAQKTRCPQGHPYDAANTKLGSDGKRRCRICANARVADHARRKRLGLPIGPIGRPRKA